MKPLWKPSWSPPNCDPDNQELMSWCSGRGKDGALAQPRTRSLNGFCDFPGQNHVTSMPISS